MIFHLVSEFLTAVFSIITGIGLFFNKNLAKGIYFLTSGLFVAAGYLAAIFYLFTPESKSLGMFTMLVCINLFAVILLVYNFKNFYTALFSDEQNIK